ncbi:glycosyltransferase family 1 protein [Marinobacter sp. R17]|uniref:glycosyltransferase family 4 protein n=1 Tax=Marinobacter sp. R17 TaxID=2484250 RepID=UPI000F4BE173|nr:glycosyltransferase family 4 protein [Marinobacter sp. R17]ROU00581.1 glycosyltransferase family 1 protein [Marinobacter sp. R17]
MTGTSDAPLRVLCLTDSCDRPESELFIGLKAAGVDVDVMCNPKGRNYQRLVEQDLVVAPLALQGRFDKEGTAAIRRQLQSKPYDVIHAYNPRALACGLRASKGMDVRVVAYRGVIGNVGAMHPESWITFLHPRVDKIVCVADAIRDHLEGLGFPWSRLTADRLQRIYKGHDLSWYQAEPADLRPLGVPEGAFVVCCTGRGVPRKGFDDLVRTALYLPEDVEVHYLLVGDVDRNETIRKEVAALPHPERVHFAGYRNDAPQLAAASDVIVLPSKEQEGLPRAVIEAMAYAIPAIVTRVGGMPELVEDGVTGLVVPPCDEKSLAEAIVKLYRLSPEERQAMGAAGRKRIKEHFHTSQTVRETAAMYQSLVDGKRRSR